MKNDGMLLGWFKVDDRKGRQQYKNMLWIETFCVLFYYGVQWFGSFVIDTLTIKTEK